MRFVVDAIRRQNQRGQSLLIVGSGSGGQWQVAAVLSLLLGFRLRGAVLGAIVANFNEELLDRQIKAISRQFRLWGPFSLMASAMPGFLSNPRRAQELRGSWEPELRKWFSVARTLASRWGKGTVSVIIYILSAGGHLPLSIRTVQLGLETFGDQLTHLVVFYLPSIDTDLVLLRNLWRPEYLAYPDDLGASILLLEDRRQNFRVIPELVLLLTNGDTVRRSQQRKLGELIARLASVSSVIGVAAASVDIPIMQLPWWLRWWRWFRHLPLTVIDELELPAKLAELLVAAYQPENRCLPFLPADCAGVEALVFGGVRVDHRTMTVSEQDKQLVDRALQQAEQTLRNRGIAWPAIPPNVVTASVFLPGDSPGNLRLTCIRLVALNKSARHFIAPLPPEAATIIGDNQEQFVLHQGADPQSNGVKAAMPPAEHGN